MKSFLMNVLLDIEPFFHTEYDIHCNEDLENKRWDVLFCPPSIVS